MSQAKRLQCDILVCGAGPAGASAALAAASKGARVLVLEEMVNADASGKVSRKASEDFFVPVPPYLLGKLPLEKKDDLVRPQRVIPRSTSATDLNFPCRNACASSASMCFYKN